MDIHVTDIEFAIKMIAALYAQGLVNTATYNKVCKSTRARMLHDEVSKKGVTKQHGAA